MRVKAVRLIRRKLLFQLIEQPRKILLLLQSAQGLRIDMAKVNGRQQSVAHAAQFDDFVDIAELFHLSHGFRADQNIAVAGTLRRVKRAAERIFGKLQRLTARDTAAGAGMYHNAIRAHLLRRVQRA